MNKLYYLLILLSLTLLASCEEEGPEVVNIKNQDPIVSVTEITPAQGYVSEQFTITGTNFGGSKEFIKVYIGDFQGKVLSCSDVKMVVQVPDEAITGKIILDILGEKIDTKQVFTVIDDPVLSAASPLTGYAGSEITFEGTNMPAKSDNLAVMVDKIQAEIVSYVVDKSGVGTMTVKIPEKGLYAGNLNLVGTIFKREFYSKKYKLLPSPVVNVYENRLVIAGNKITLTGSGLHDFKSKMKINFDGTIVVPEESDISTDQIIVEVPSLFAGGEVSVELEGFGVVKLGTWQVMNGSGDVTSNVLKNSVQPFIKKEGDTGTEWAVPADWNFNENFKGGALQFTNEIPEGLLAMESGNGQAVKQDAKMYQVITLPKGKYRFELNVADCHTNGGRFGILFAVSAGNATIPGLSDQLAGHKGSWWFVDESVILTSYRISDNQSAHQKVVELNLDEDKEVTIGFVTQLNGNGGWAKLSSVKVTLE